MSAKAVSITTAKLQEENERTCEDGVIMLLSHSNEEVCSDTWTLAHWRFDLNPLRIVKPCQHLHVQQQVYVEGSSLQKLSYKVQDRHKQAYMTQIIQVKRTTQSADKSMSLFFFFPSLEFRCWITDGANALQNKGTTLNNMGVILPALNKSTV